MSAWFSFVRPKFCLPLASSSLLLSAFINSALRADPIYHLTCDQKTKMLRILRKASCIFSFKKLFIIANPVHKSSIYNESLCTDYDYPAPASLNTCPVLPHPYCHTPIYCPSLHHIIFESNRYHFI